MKKLFFSLFLGFVVAMTGCNRYEKEARGRLENARNMYRQDELFAAKNEIDTIRTRYPKEIKVLKEALELMRQVELKEVVRNIAYCDSMIPVRQAELPELTKGFVFEKDSLYEEKGNYVWKQQTIERNVERSYVRCGVNETGEMYLASVYFGNRPVKHTGIRISNADGVFTTTASIPYDGGVNYRFEDLGNTTEVVTYKGDQCVDAVKFIYDNNNQRLKVEYTGGSKAFTMYMAEGDKKAIVSTFNLATALSDVETLRTERDKAIRKKEYLEKKLH
jgi:hypothetical protein